MGNPEHSPSYPGLSPCWTLAGSRSGSPGVDLAPNEPEPHELHPFYSAGRDV